MSERIHHSHIVSPVKLSWKQEKRFTVVCVRCGASDYPINQDGSLGVISESCPAAEKEPLKIHQSHRIRMSDSSLSDEARCEKCGASDYPTGEILSHPCPLTDEMASKIHPSHRIIVEAAGCTDRVICRICGENEDSLDIEKLTKPCPHAK